MANEIRVGVNLSCVNGNFISNQDYTKEVDQATEGGGNPGTISVATAYAQISGLADMTNEGYCIARNLDSTNYLEIGVEVSAAFYPLIKLKAGEISVFRLTPGVSVFARANTAACRLHFWCLED
jgi:hypothetical protein